MSTEEQNKTPSSHWKANGEKDFHAGQYDCERAGLLLGRLTDDEIANGLFMNYDKKLDDHRALTDANYISPIAWATGAKDRIRWLSRSLENALAEITRLKDALGHKDRVSDNFPNGGPGVLKQPTYPIKILIEYTLNDEDIRKAEALTHDELLLLREFFGAFNLGNTVNIGAINSIGLNNLEDYGYVMQMEMRSDEVEPIYSITAKGYQCFKQVSYNLSLSVYNFNECFRLADGKLVIKPIYTDDKSSHKILHDIISHFPLRGEDRRVNRTVYDIISRNSNLYIPTDEEKELLDNYLIGDEFKGIVLSAINGHIQAISSDDTPSPGDLEWKEKLGLFYNHLTTVINGRKYGWTGQY